MTPTDYAQHCGPRALAALLGFSPESAAALLLRLAREHGGGVTAEGGTSLSLVLRALRLFGRVAVPHDEESGEPTGETTDAFFARIVELDARVGDALAAAREVIEAQPLPERPGLWRSFWHGTGDALTVERFRWRRPAGEWLLVARGRPWAHYVVLRGARVVAGDDGGLTAWGGAPVAVALKIEATT